jgi:hypothetical protein
MSSQAMTLELTRMEHDVPHYEEAFMLANEWLELAVLSQQLGCIHDVQNRLARHALRPGWARSYITRVEALHAAKLFEHLQDIVTERQESLTGLLGTLRGWYSRDMKNALKALVGSLPRVAAAADTSDVKDATITLGRVKGRVLAIADLALPDLD